MKTEHIPGKNTKIHTDGERNILRYVSEKNTEITCFTIIKTETLRKKSTYSIY